MSLISWEEKILKHFQRLNIATVNIWTSSIFNDCTFSKSCKMLETWKRCICQFQTLMIWREMLVRMIATWFMTIKSQRLGSSTPSPWASKYQFDPVSLKLCVRGYFCFDLPSVTALMRYKAIKPGSKLAITQHLTP